MLLANFRICVRRTGGATPLYTIMYRKTFFCAAMNYRIAGNFCGRDFNLANWRKSPDFVVPGMWTNLYTPNSVFYSCVVSFLLSCQAHHSSVLVSCCPRLLTCTSSYIYYLRTFMYSRVNGISLPKINSAKHSSAAHVIAPGIARTGSWAGPGYEAMNLAIEGWAAEALIFPDGGPALLDPGLKGSERD